MLIRIGLFLLIPALLSIKFGVTPQSIGLLPLALISLELIRTDMKFFKLPNKLVYSSFFITVLYITIFSILKKNINYFTEPILMSVVFFSAGLIFYLFGRNAFGAGDVKLLALAGLNLGYFSVELALLAALLTFSSLLVVAVVLLISKRATATTRIPFGPFLIISTWFSIILFG